MSDRISIDRRPRHVARDALAEAVGAASRGANEIIGRSGVEALRVMQAREQRMVDIMLDVALVAQRQHNLPREEIVRIINGRLDAEGFAVRVRS